jgi:hypothetical protein
LSPNAAFLLRPSYGRVQYPDLSGVDNDITQAIAVLEQSPQQRMLGWRVSAQQRIVEFDNGEKVDLARLDYGIGLPIGMRAVWIFNGGRERNEYQTLSTDLQVDDTLWFTGLQWGNARTDVLALVGNRFFGDTYNFEFTHRAKYFSLDVNYEEDLQTTGLQLQPISSIDYARRRERPPLLEGLEGVSNEVFVAKRFGVMFTYEKSKSTIDVDLVDESRDFQTEEGSDSLYGAGFRYTWRMLSRTQIVFDVDGRNREFDFDDRKDKERDYIISLRYQFTHRFFGDLSYTHATRDSTQDELDYTYNLASVALSASL